MRSPGHKYNDVLIRSWIREHLGLLDWRRTEAIGISGGAAGIDQEAERIFRELSISFLPILPMTSGVDGYLTRDRWIAWLSTDLLCIEASWSATKGARLTAEIARAMGRRVTHLIVRAPSDQYGEGITHVCGIKLADLEKPPV